MRDIKFRGKWRVDGTWIFGDLQRAADGEIYIFPPKGTDSYNRYEVISETVGQFTGLKDDSGVEIYEGDIIKLTIGLHYWEAVIQTVPDNKSNTLYAIETFHNVTTDEDGETYIYLRSDSRKGTRMDIEYLIGEIKILGSIHDNPELINQ